MIVDHFKIKYTAHGCDWEAKGTIEGTWDDFDRMQKAFEIMESMHEEAMKNKGEKHGIR